MKRSESSLFEIGQCCERSVDLGETLDGLLCSDRAKVELCSTGGCTRATFMKVGVKLMVSSQLVSIVVALSSPLPAFLPLLLGCVLDQAENCPCTDCDQATSAAQQRLSEPDSVRQ